MAQGLMLELSPWDPSRAPHPEVAEALRAIGFDPSAKNAYGPRFSAVRNGPDPELLGDRLRLHFWSFGESLMTISDRQVPKLGSVAEILRKHAISYYFAGAKTGQVMARFWWPEMPRERFQIARNLPDLSRLEGLSEAELGEALVRHFFD